MARVIVFALLYAYRRQSGATISNALRIARQSTLVDIPPALVSLLASMFAENDPEHVTLDLFAAKTIQAMHEASNAEELARYQAWRAKYPVCPPHERGCPGTLTAAPLVGCPACEWLHGAPL